MPGKSKQVIGERREAKKAFVEFIIAAVEKRPLALMDKVLPEQDTDSLFVDLKEFSPTIESNKAALETAKGCTAPPKVTRTGHTGNLYTFLILYKLGESAGCFSSWLQDAVEWAKQVVDSNPHSFLTGWRPYQTRLDATKNRFAVDDKSYRLNPTNGEPRNADQAFYYLIYQAGEIYFTQFKEDVSKKGEAQTAWFDRFTKLEPDIRRNPNIANLKDRGLDFAVTKYEKFYINGEL